MYLLTGIKLNTTIESAVTGSGISDGSYLQHLSGNMAKYLMESKSDNTAKSYFYGFKKWERFIQEQGHSALPANPVHVALYITKLLDDGATHNSVEAAIYSIKWAHELGNQIDPTLNTFITSLRESARRIARPKVNKKDPVTVSMLVDLCILFRDKCDLLTIRDLSMILLSFAGFLRYDELSSLKCCDVVLHDDHLCLYINKSKTDQYRNGNEVLISKGNTAACPYNMFLKYVEIADINLLSDQYLFKAVFKSKNVCKLIYKNKKLSYTRARECIISKLKLVSTGLNLGLHSMRSGGATEAAKSVVNDRCWKRHGRWRSETSKDGYVKDTIEKRLEVSKSLNL